MDADDAGPRSGDRFSVTHEFLAMLLGSSRPSGSVVIDDFTKRGMLKVERGRVLIADRHRLVTVSCDHEVIAAMEYFLRP